MRRLACGPSGEMDVLLAILRGPKDFERLVVLKQAASTPEARARLEREALAHARLVHPAIVRLYEVDAATLVLEHVDGPSLAGVLEVLHAKTERLPINASLYITHRVFSALAAAHSARHPITREFAPVVHRDVCPANVLVGWDGWVKLTDFDGHPESTEWLAPEQARGGAVTVRSDVYAGALLLRALLDGRPIDDERLASAVVRALAPDPEARDVTAADLAILLRQTIDVHVAKNELAHTLARFRRDRAADALGVPLPQPTPRETTPDPTIVRLGNLFDDSAPSLIANRAITSRPPPLAGSPYESGVVRQVGRHTSEPAVAISTTLPLALPKPPRLPPMMSVETPLVMATSIAETPRAPATDEAPPRGSFPSAQSLPLTTRAPRTWSRGLLLAAALASAVVFGVLAFVLLASFQTPSGKPAVVVAAEPPPPAAPLSKEPVAVASVASPSALPAAAEPKSGMNVRSAGAAPPPVKAKPAPTALAPTPAGTTGKIVTDASESGHRVFVDGRLAGAGGRPLVVRCGAHSVRVGSAGALRKVDVPCGGEVSVVR